MTWASLITGFHANSHLSVWMSSGSDFMQLAKLASPGRSAPIALPSGYVKSACASCKATGAVPCATTTCTATTPATPSDPEAATNPLLEPAANPAPEPSANTDHDHTTTNAVLERAADAEHEPTTSPTNLKQLPRPSLSPLPTPTIGMLPTTPLNSTRSDSFPPSHPCHSKG